MLWNYFVEITLYFVDFDGNASILDSLSESSDGIGLWWYNDVWKYSWRGAGASNKHQLFQALQVKSLESD